MTDPTPQTTPTRDEAVPAGWKLVPVEPTEAMMAIGRTCGTNSANTYAAMLAPAPAPASGGVDAVGVCGISADTESKRVLKLHFKHEVTDADRKTIIDAFNTLNRERRSALSPAATPVQTANCCHCGRIIDTRETTQGGDEFGAELSDGRWTCSPECWDAVVEPAATPVSDAKPVANDCPNCGGSGIVNIDRDDDDNCPECSGTGDEPSTCYNTGLHCLAGCDGKTCIGANLPLNRWPAQAPGGDVRKALEGFRSLTKPVMTALMATRGRDDLLLADQVHRADTAARIALSQSTSAGRVGE